MFFPKMGNGFLLIGHGTDFSRRIAGCLNGGAEGVFVQRLLGVDYRLSLGMGGETFSTGNVARMASLMWTSHMEQAMPKTLAVVWVISIPSFRIMDFSKIVHSYTAAMQAKGIEQEMLFHDLHAKIAAVVATPQRHGSLSKELRMQTGIADVIAALLSSHQQC